MEKLKEKNIGKENKWERRVRVQHQHSMRGGDCNREEEGQIKSKACAEHFMGASIALLAGAQHFQEGTIALIGCKEHFHGGRIALLGREEHFHGGRSALSAGAEHFQGGRIALLAGAESFQGGRIALLGREEHFQGGRSALSAGAEHIQRVCGTSCWHRELSGRVHHASGAGAMCSQEKYNAVPKGGFKERRMC